MNAFARIKKLFSPGNDSDTKLDTFKKTLTKMDGQIEDLIIHGLANDQKIKKLELENLNLKIQIDVYRNMQSALKDSSHELRRIMQTAVENNDEQDPGENQPPVIH